MAIAIHVNMLQQIIYLIFFGSYISLSSDLIDIDTNVRVCVFTEIHENVYISFHIQDSFCWIS